MKILLLSTGGGGGNILRSIKAMFRRDLAVAQKTDARYAERLRRAVTARFLDTNEFSLADVPQEERLLIGADKTRRLGSRHNPLVAQEALQESKQDVEVVLRDYSVVVLIGTGGKGTGAGTIFPLAQMAREQRKLVIPIFVRPSFEWHEVDKRRYDHALRVIDQFDSARIRCMEVLNDRGYSAAAPQPQSIVWERMNLPIARGLRGLLYVLSDLSQVDPSDLCTLCAGPGRYRIGFAEVDPSPGQDPGDSHLDDACRQCWENSYYSFARPAGTSLVCIQGEWSNIVDGKIKGRLAAWAAGNAAESTYTPLYARSPHSPRPWGVTALFAEHTGTHPPLDVDWPLAGWLPLPSKSPSTVKEETLPAPAVDVPATGPVPVTPAVVAATPAEQHTPPQPQFPTFWEVCLGVNRRNAAALAIAANGAAAEIPLDGAEIRKLLGTLWFRTVFTQFSREWHSRMLDVLSQHLAIPNHVVHSGRRAVRLSELAYEDLKQLPIETILPDAVRADVQLLVVVGSLWSPEAVKRFELVDVPGAKPAKTLFSLAAFR